MRELVFTGLCLLALGGCAADIATPSRLSYPDTVCAGIARQRAADARDNNVDPSIVPRIFSDTYASCRRDNARDGAQP